MRLPKSWGIAKYVESESDIYVASVKVVNWRRQEATASEDSLEMIRSALQDGDKMAGKNPGTTMHILRGAGPEGRSLVVITGDVSKKVITVMSMGAKKLEKEIMKATRIPQVR